jgi:hypothetical protein
MRQLAAAIAVVVALSATPALAAPAPAATPASPGESKTLSPWLILGWNQSWGLGASFQFPLVPHGLIHDPGFTIHDSLDFDVGLDYLWYRNTYYSGPYTYDITELDLHAGLIWNFWLTPRVAIYPKAGLGFGIVNYSYSANWNPGWGHGSYGGVYPELAAGAQLKLGNSIALRGELGWSGLKLGLGFDF